MTFVIGLVTLFKGLKNLKLDFDLPEALACSARHRRGRARCWGASSCARAACGRATRPLRSVERVFGCSR